MPTAQGTRGPVKVLKRPSSPSLEAKTVITRRNVHKISPPKAFLACDHGPRVGEEERGEGGMREAVMKSGHISPQI